LKKIYIEWADAISSGCVWINKDELEDWLDTSEWIVKQVGFVLKETDKYILLASHYKLEDKWGVEQYGHLQKIPKGWIRKIKVL